MTAQKKISQRLKTELRHLEQTLDMGHELRVTWLPGHARRVNGRRILGEVIDKTIFIYAESESEALLVLRHEALEHALTIRFVAPYRKLINALLAAIEAQNYTEKEKFVKILSRLIWGGEK